MRSNTTNNPWTRIETRHKNSWLSSPTTTTTTTTTTQISSLNNVRNYWLFSSSTHTRPYIREAFSSMWIVYVESSSRTKKEEKEREKEKVGTSGGKKNREWVNELFLLTWLTLCSTENEQYELDENKKGNVQMDVHVLGFSRLVIATSSFFSVCCRLSSDYIDDVEELSTIELLFRDSLSHALRGM